MGNAYFGEGISVAGVAEFFIKADRPVPGMERDTPESLGPKMVFEVHNEPPAHSGALEFRFHRHLEESPFALVLGMKEDAADDSLVGDRHEVQTLALVREGHIFPPMAEGFSQDSEPQIQFLLVEGVVDFDELQHVGLRGNGSTALR